ncbi:MAG: MotA/TolQ/ExbB proton channel family protein [Halothiobacillaceae bacterium]
MFELVQAGGWLMFPILLASVLATAIVIERFWSLRRRRVITPGLVDDVVAAWHKGQPGEEQLARLTAGSSLGAIFAAGLKPGLSREEMKERVEDAGRHEAHRLERYLNTLGTIAVISPLLGLLGTVVGIIDVFNALSNEAQIHSEVLAGGIAKALVTTAAGIIVAVPAFVFHRYFRGLVDELVIDMERETIRLVETLHPACPVPEARR